MPVADTAALLLPATVAVAPNQNVVWVPVDVQPGDSVWALAQKHRTTVSEIVRRNALAHGGSWIHPGQRLLVPVIPSSATTPVTIPAKRPNTPAGQPASHPARPSQPSPSTTAPASPAGTTYVVRSGDTLSGIAARYGSTVGAIATTNRVTDPRRIYPGQRLIIPGKSSAAPTTRPVSTTPRPVATPRPQTPAPTLLNRTQTADLIRATAIRYGVDPKLALAIGYQESGWNQAARSWVGAVGVMQIMPIAATWASQLAGRRLDVTRVEDNVLAGVLILKALIHAADNLDQAIGGYYQGLPSVQRRGFYSDTYRYVANVKALAAKM